MIKKISGNYLIIIFLYTIFICLPGCKAQNEDKTNQTDGHQFTNDLINEKSPYLLQHAHNPVNWHAWNDATLQLAKNKNKPLLISIGYAACHWCHVMEEESYMDTVVANYMNENFICIKVDREERPDIDQIYIEAAQLISGNVGWPLNALALPDGKPFYALTYLTKDEWMKFLKHFSDEYKNNLPDLESQAAKITQGIRESNPVSFKESGKGFEKETTTLMTVKILDRFDHAKGGMKGSIKFPMPDIYNFLLRDYYFNKNKASLKAVETTLDKLMTGGIYDQIGGGFSRYSTDENWLVPHFEKMLYDNAQLISLYSNTYKVTKNEDYKDVVFKTIDFLERELSDSNGGYYSSLDADSEGEEGKFYVWSYDDLKRIISDPDFTLFEKVYDVTPAGNFEGMNILSMKGDYNKLASDNNISVQQLKEKTNQWKLALLNERSKRIRPRLDNKIITAWNALAIRGYIEAYNAFGDKKFLQEAVKTAEYLKRECIKNDNSLMRIPASNINGFLDDYAQTIDAFIKLYEATFDQTYLNTALKLTEYVNAHFDDQVTKFYFYTSDNSSSLAARKIDTDDNVIASSNSVFANCLMKLSEYYGKPEYETRAKQMISAIKDKMETYPQYFCNWGIDYFNVVYTPFEVAIAGPEALKFNSQLNSSFLPDVIYYGTLNGASDLPLLESKFKEGETIIYVCRNKVCKNPVTSVEDAMKMIVR